ncbi:hypothetical protein CF65_02019 [Aggregatibacter actinomycetemcomitans HK1651]|nr:hypothetical protein CF65_02019 [Aggregatibacter actinomycetemcomitans HK1651]
MYKIPFELLISCFFYLLLVGEISKIAPII